MHHFIRRQIHALHPCLIRIAHRSLKKLWKNPRKLLFNRIKHSKEESKRDNYRMEQGLGFCSGMSTFNLYKNRPIIEWVLKTGKREEYGDAEKSHIAVYRD
jgi:hypothetical protein